VVERDGVDGQGIGCCLALMTVCGMTMQAPLSADAQFDPGSAPQTQATREPYTHLTPSLRLAHRYDSNVFLVPGTNLEDFVTTIAPQVKLAHKNQWAEGTIRGGATAEFHVNNPGLNYVGANGIVDLDLHRAMAALLPGLGLRVSNNILYTPQPLAFAAPLSGNQLSVAFVQGVQAQRANSFSNAAEAEASYMVSPFLGVTSTYTDRRIRFGSPIAPQTGVVTGGFIDTNSQTLTSGLVGTLSSADKLSLLHQYQKATFPNLGRGGGEFSTQGAIAKWSRLMRSTLQATVEGGLTVISSSNDVNPIGAVSLQWNGQYTNLHVSYSRVVVPSMLFVSTPLVNEIVTCAVRRQITEVLSVSLNGNYAINKSVPDSSLLKFESYSVTPSVQYRLGRTITATLAYTRSHFQNAVSLQSFEFDRNMVMISLLSEWK
jgi:hypothetical protein